MARVKTGTIRRKRHHRLLKKASGYRGERRRSFRKAKEAVRHARAYAFAGRKQRKRQMRRSWIAEINAVARQSGTTYSKLITAMREKGPVNRKTLAQTLRENPAIAHLVPKGTLPDAKKSPQATAA